MAYTPDVFADGPEGGTPITAAKLNKLGLALAAADEAAVAAAALAAEKADAAEVAAAFALTASAVELEAGLEAGLAEKADDAAVSVALAAKADAAATTAALAAKADAAALTAGLAEKADAAATTAALALKANQAAVDSALALKSNAATVTASLAAKADLVDGKVPAAQIPSGTSAPLDSPTFTTAVGLPGGSANRRLPVNGSVVLDGNVIRTLPGDKVGYAFSATIKGGFTGDTGGNPTFAWGANDFVVTGSATGDVAGLANVCGRETELHLHTPNSSLANMKGLQVNCKVEAEAVGATVGSMFGIYVTPVAKAAGTVTNAYGIYIEAPTAGVTNKALHAVGAVEIVGATTINGATTLKGAVTQESGSAKFVGATGANLQGAPAGVYLGTTSGGEYGLNIANGTTTFGIDLAGTTLRFMKSATHEAASISENGDLKVRRGFSVHNTALVTSKRPATADATDLATAITLVNALKADLVAYGLKAA